MKLYEYTAWKNTVLPSLGLKHLFFHKKRGNRILSGGVCDRKTLRGWKNNYLKLAYQGFNEIEIIRDTGFKLENLNSLAPKLFFNNLN